MITIQRIEVLANFSEFYVLQWAIADTLEDVDDYTFNVYKSLSPDSEYTKIAGPITGTSYTYENPNKLDSSIHEYFKIEAVSTTTSEKLLSSVYGSLLLTPRDYVSEAIIYQHRYFLENLLNRPHYQLLIRRRTGTRCTSCWDADTGEVTRSHCNVCYSTGYSQGYMDPITIHMSLTESSYSNRMDPMDVRDVQQDVLPAWTTNYPLILPGDVIVDSLNRRYRVAVSQPTTKDGSIYLRQLLQLQRIPLTDVVYSLSL